MATFWLITRSDDGYFLAHLVERLGCFLGPPELSQTLPKTPLLALAPRGR